MAVAHLERTERAPDRNVPVMGFGTRFIVRSMDYEFEGVAKLTFDPDGCRCAIEFPLRNERELVLTG